MQPDDSSGSSAMIRAAIALAVFAVVALLIFLLDPDNLYLWVKALHVIAVISWMAGMLYLPRLFVYHAECRAGLGAVGNLQGDGEAAAARHHQSGDDRDLGVRPWLAWKGFGFHGRLAACQDRGCVVLMSAVHGYLAGAVRKFAEDRNEKSARHWRIVNEVPTLLMIAIVILVVVKPF